jgi:hypothetical protein
MAAQELFDILKFRLSQLVPPVPPEFTDMGDYGRWKWVQAIWDWSITDSDNFRNLVHLMATGPAAAGFGSGVVFEALPPGSVFPTQLVWWTDATKTKMIFDKVLVRGANQMPLTITWTRYAEIDGITPVEQIVDTITYAPGGIIEESRVRTFTPY